MPRTTGRGPTRGPGAPSTHPGEAWGTACPHPAFQAAGLSFPVHATCSAAFVMLPRAAIAGRAGGPGGTRASCSGGFPSAFSSRPPHRRPGGWRPGGSADAGLCPPSPHTEASPTLGAPGLQPRNGDDGVTFGHRDPVKMCPEGLEEAPGRAPARCPHSTKEARGWTS